MATKQQIIEAVINEIMKGVSTRIREIVREEVDIERKRVRKQLLEELREQFDSPQQVSRPTQSRPDPMTHGHPPAPKKTRIDTGDNTINAILEGIQTDMEDMVPEMKFAAESTVGDVSKQMVLEHRTTPSSEYRGTGLWKPDAGEAYDFDPKRMDPSQIDWSNMVDALENKTALPGDRK